MDAAGAACETTNPAAERAGRHLALLQELAEIGMQMARAVRDEALACPADEPARAGDLGLSFSRIARAVRQTVALEARLAEEGRAEPRTLSVSDRWRAIRRKRQVSTIIDDIIEETEGRFPSDSLLTDLAERLDEGDETADFADRPIGELVERICRDLDLPFDLSLFEDEDWAIEEARLRPAGSPFAARPPDCEPGDSAAEAPGKLSPKPPWKTH